MTDLTEVPGNLPSFQWQDNDSSGRNLPTIQGKITVVPTETPGNLPTI